jgi:hypothetical protein
MNAEPRTIACSLPPRPRRRAGCPPRPSDAVAPPPPVPLGRLPRVARLLALALRLEQLVQTGVSDRQQREDQLEFLSVTVFGVNKW